MLTQSQQETIRHQFDSYCKKILRGERSDYLRSVVRRNKREICFSEMETAQTVRLQCEDTYPSDKYLFYVKENAIEVENQRLAAVLLQMPEKKRDIVLLAYCEGMNDREIGDLLHIVRRTVHYCRTSALRDMKKMWEDLKDLDEKV